MLVYSLVFSLYFVVNYVPPTFVLSISLDDFTSMSFLPGIEATDMCSLLEQFEGMETL